MTDILCKKDGKTYFISTNKGETHVNQMVIKNGFITYQEINHDLTLHDVHLIKNHGGNKKYKLIKDITKEKLPNHKIELEKILKKF